MTLSDELMQFDHRPLPQASFTRTYRRSRYTGRVRRHSERRHVNFAYLLWEIYAAACISLVSTIILGAIAWAIYEKLS